MIVALLFLIAGSVLYVVAFAFSPLNLLIPAALITSITSAFSFPAFFFNVFPPLTALLSGFSFLITLWLARFYISLIVMGINLIPGVHVQLPWFSHPEDTSSSQAIGLHNRFKSVMSGRDRISK